MGAVMIVRKSNLDDQSQFGGNRAFNALAWFDRPAKRRFAFVKLRAPEVDVKKLLLRDVVIDGAHYFCLDVRTFSPPPFNAGDSIGLLVVDA
jgi:hypothetical protein